MKLTKKHLIASAATLGVLALPMSALALSFDTSFAGSIGFTSTDLKQTVLNIITFVLGLLGLIAVIMILYGGFIWLTAGGNEDKVDTAKKIISSAAIGLVVVLISWAIVNFVLRTTAQVTS
ncbi:hypothetical protein C4546_04685 [Candidatus Parcubacteria bacterium]|jgi:hypothetical protein|nr:MAG: hypothetical protein C4546_04685 [Candidatus Parcubacteria bacterium]